MLMERNVAEGLFRWLSHVEGMADKRLVKICDSIETHGGRDGK